MSLTCSSSAAAAAVAHDRELISTLFRERIASGDARPLLIGHSLVANFAIPCLYLAVPHRGRPWLYRARFLVAALVAVLNLEMARHTRSDNLAVTYATGILAAWYVFFFFFFSLVLVMLPLLLLPPPLLHNLSLKHS